MHIFAKFKKWSYMFDMSCFGVGSHILKKVNFSWSKTSILLPGFSNFFLFCFIWQSMLSKMKFNCQPQVNSTGNYYLVINSTQLKAFVGNRNGKFWNFQLFFNRKLEFKTLPQKKGFNIVITIHWNHCMCFLCINNTSNMSVLLFNCILSRYHLIWMM